MKDNKVIFWSVIKGLEEVIPPQPAKKYIPEWWKNTPPFVPTPNIEGKERQSKRNRSTIKVCPAIHDWFLQGYVIPMWCDLYLEMNEDGSWSCEHSYPNDLMTAEMSQDSVYITWLPEQYKKNAVAMLRLDCPWRMKTPSGYSSYQFPMYYHFNPDFEVPPGPIWTDEYHLIDPQIIIKHYGVTKINRGTPLCAIVPYKREPDDTFHYEIKRRDEECEILEQKTDLIQWSKFEGGYKEMQKEKGGCPMHKEHK
jgi:hypothetical protein